MFAFSLETAAYNVISTVKAALRAKHGYEKVENEVSEFYLAAELRAVYEGVIITIAPRERDHFERMTLLRLGNALTRLAGLVRLEKAPRTPRESKNLVAPRT